MIKWLIKIFFKKELKEIIGEARKILDDTKMREMAQAKKEFITYERIDTGTEYFLRGMQPFYENKFLVSWLNEHKMQCMVLINNAMAACDDKRVINTLSQVTMIDSLFLDLEEFKRRYDEMLVIKKEEQNE